MKKRLKTVFLLLMLLTLCLYIFSFNSNFPLTVSLISLCIMLFLYYVYLLIIKAKILINIVYLLPALICLYICTFPIFYFYTDIFTIYLKNISNADIVISTIYSIGFVELYCLFTFFMPCLLDSRIDAFSVFNRLKLGVRNIPIDIIFAFFSFLFAYKIYSIGGINYLLSGLISRRDISDYLYTIPLYAYIKQAFIGYAVMVILTFLNVGKKRSDIFLYVFRIAVILIFFLLNIAAGNRREFVYIILAVFLYYSYKNKGKVSNKTLLFVAISCITLLNIGYYRMVIYLGTQNSAARILDEVGEFLYPIVTLYYYVANKKNNFYLGITVFNFILNFIPRTILPNKPNSLGAQFKIDYSTTMGYAFTPLTELYINFSFFGFFIGAILFSYIFYKISKNKNKYPLLYLACFMELINFFRGEIASSLFEVFIMYGIFLIMIVINKNKVDNSNIP